MLIVMRKLFTIFSVKQRKHDAIKLITQSKLDSVSHFISQAMQKGDVSSIKLQNVFQEVENIANSKLMLKTKLKPK